MSEELGHPDIIDSKVDAESSPEIEKSPLEKLAQNIIDESAALSRLPENVQKHIHTALVTFAEVGVPVLEGKWNSSSIDEQIDITRKQIQEDAPESLDQIDAIAVLLQTQDTPQGEEYKQGRAYMQARKSIGQLFTLIQRNHTSIHDYYLENARNSGKSVAPGEEGRQSRSTGAIREGSGRNRAGAPILKKI